MSGTEDAMQELARQQVLEDRAQAQMQVRLIGEMLARPLPIMTPATLDASKQGRDALIRELCK